MSNDRRKPLATYRELDVWKKSMDLVEEIYRVTANLPADERFGLTSQMRRASISVPSNIAEGYGRKDRGDYVRHLSISNGSLKELETQLIIAGRLKLIEREKATKAWSLIQDVGKMLAKLKDSLVD